VIDSDRALTLVDELLTAAATDDLVGNRAWWVAAAELDEGARATLFFTTIEVAAMAVEALETLTHRTIAPEAIVGSLVDAVKERRGTPGQDGLSG
jgi:hypothetical protein